MTAVSSFPILFRQHLADTDSATPLDALIDIYINGETVDAAQIERVLDGEYADLPNGLSPQGSPWELVDKWRELLTIALIARDAKLLPVYRHHLIHRAVKLAKCMLWNEFQILEAYQSIMERLLDINCHTTDASGTSRGALQISQLQSGASPLETGAHWAWGDIPHPQFHAELGTLWCLYSSLAPDERVLGAAVRLAEWQINTLDYDFIPFAGLYSQEGDSSDLSLLMSNFILFDAVSRISNRGDMAYIAEQQSDRLAVLLSLPPGPIPIHALVLKEWFERHHSQPPAVQVTLPSNIQDQSLAFVGFRSQESSGVATLYGGGSGMGCFNRGDVQVVNFGPQHFPLGDCRGFGLEGAGRLLAGKVEIVDTSEEGFVLQGVCRMTGRPKEGESPAGFRHGDPSGCWLETRVEMLKGHYCIESTFNGIYDDRSFAFVFFVKASGCVVDGNQSIKPRSFQHYQGEIRSVHLKGEHGTIAIEASNRTGEMRVVPLGGGQNFWGADYLIAYQCHADLGCYRWHLNS